MSDGQCVYCQAATGDPWANCCSRTQCIQKVLDGIKPPARQNKYNAQRCEADGHKFDSKKERARYLELKLLEQAGEISNLELQPEYWLEVNGHTICMYVADFRYEEDGQVVTEDCKGVRTRVYRIKRALMLAVHGVEIKET